MAKAFPVALATGTVASLVLMDPQLSGLYFLPPLLIVVPFVLPVTLLLWTSLPAWLARRTRAGLPLLLLGLGLPIGLALWLPRHADALAAQDLAALGQIAPQRLDRPGPIGVEITRPLQPEAAFVTRTDRPPIDREICPELCERLLLGGDVAWVRVVIPDDRLDFQTVESTALFERGSAGECLALTGSSDRRTCILYRPDHGQPADLALIVTTLAPKLTDWAYHPRAVTLVEGITADGEPILRLAHVVQDRPTGGLAPAASGGLQLNRTRAKTAPIDIDRAVEALGLGLAPPLPRTKRPPAWVRGGFDPMPPDPQDTAYMASQLQTGPQQGTEFSLAFQLAAERWLRSLDAVDQPTEIEVRTYCSVLAETRFPAAFRAGLGSGRHGVRCQTL